MTTHMRIGRTWLVAWMLACCSGPVLASSANASDDMQSCRRGVDTDRPRIGLALGGGGARGIAHIGILRKLEELKVPVDCIAGTSMGSLVGGLYASGMRVDELEALVQSLDWEALFDDSLARRERSYRRKQDDRSSMATIGIGLREGQVRLSGGVLQGQRILALFERSTLRVSAIDDFDELPIPFRATATDLNTGEAVVLDRGSLAMAMRASMSLPGVFHPAVIDGRVLLDGGLANQVPVDVVRAMGADIVIAVDVGTPLSRFGDDASVLDVLSQMTTMMTTRNTRMQLETLTARDVLIVPELGDAVATGDFGKAAEALALGNAAAETAAPTLATLGLTDTSYSVYRNSHAVSDADPTPIIDFVRMDNQTPYADDYLLRHFGQVVGAPIDTSRMEEGTLRAYGLGTLSSVTYEVIGEQGQTGVLIRAREKSQGPNYLQLGLRANSDRGGDFESNLRVGMLFSPLSPYGAEGRITAAIGSEPELQAEYLHPFDMRNRYLLYGRAGYSNSNVHVYDDAGNDIAVYDVNLYGGELRIGREFGNHGAFGIGLERAAGRAKVEIGAPSAVRHDIDHAVWYVNASVDRLDSLYFPRSGYYATLGYRSSAAFIGADHDYAQAGMDIMLAKESGAHAVQFGLGWHSTISGQAPIHERYRLGGRGRLVGYRYNELTGQHYALGVVGYTYRLGGVLGHPALVGGTIEYGNAWEQRKDMAFGDGLFNASLYLGFDSWLGPMLLGYGWRQGGEGVLFLDIGRPF